MPMHRFLPKISKKFCRVVAVEKKEGHHANKKPVNFPFQCKSELFLICLLLAATGGSMIAAGVSGRLISRPTTSKL